MEPIKRILLPNEKLFPVIFDLLSKRHTVSINIRGNSMRPFLESDRDIIVLSSATTYRVGDVVIAEIQKGTYIFHRIESIEGGIVRLRGDGNVNQTETCRISDLRAVATAFIRKGKTITTDSAVWKIYSKCWTALLPARRFLLAVYRLWHRATTTSHQ